MIKKYTVNKYKKICLIIINMCLLLLLFVMCCSIISKAETYNIDNPVITSNTVKWDKVKFGNYYQSIKEFETKPIKWRVLSIDQDNGTAILMADEALDCKPYNDADEKTTWEKCSLRQWLNNDFYNNAFSKDEQDYIEDTIQDDQSTLYAEAGNNTVDKVYLLSQSDASNSAFGFNENYGSSSVERKAKATDYARMKGMSRFKNDDCENVCYWWLRTRGFYSDAASYVSPWGEIDSIGSSVNDNNVGVRPVIRVDMSSPYIKSAGEIDSYGKITALNDGYNDPAKSDNRVIWDCVYFGNYQQNALYNYEPIEWKVLSVNENKALLVADKVLNSMPFDINSDNTWETCSLRGWLNDDAYDLFFSDMEKNAIIENDKNDNIFLLSIDDINNKSYGFINDKSREVKATEYAFINGCYISKDLLYEGNCYWWLNSAGEDENHTSVIYYNGGCSKDGRLVDYDMIGVCPALYINLSFVQIDDGIIRVDENTLSSGVDNLISNIGTVNENSKTAIADARNAYDALNDKAKEKVTKLSVLEAAEAVIQEIEKNANISTSDSSKESDTSDINDQNKDIKQVDNSDHNTGTNTNTNNQSENGQQEITVQQSTNDNSSGQVNTGEKTAMPARVKLSSVKNNKSKSYVAIWKKVKDAKGYEIQYALNKKFTKSKKSVFTSKTTMSVKKLKKGKTYYVRVRAYNTDSKGNKVNGKWCLVKKIKIKK